MGLLVQSPGRKSPRPRLMITHPPRALPAQIADWAPAGRSRGSEQLRPGHVESAAAGLSRHGPSGGSPYPQAERRPARRGQGARQPQHRPRPAGRYGEAITAGEDGSRLPRGRQPAGPGKRAKEPRPPASRTSEHPGGAARCRRFRSRAVLSRRPSRQQAARSSRRPETGHSRCLRRGECRAIPGQPGSVSRLGGPGHRQSPGVAGRSAHSAESALHGCGSVRALE
jgi:hypothetical protein